MRTHKVEQLVIATVGFGGAATVPGFTLIVYSWSE